MDITFDKPSNDSNKPSGTVAYVVPQYSPQNWFPVAHDCMSGLNCPFRDTLNGVCGTYGFTWSFANMVSNVNENGQKCAVTTLMENIQKHLKKNVKASDIFSFEDLQEGNFICSLDLKDLCSIEFVIKGDVRRGKAAAKQNAAFKANYQINFNAL